MKKWACKKQSILLLLIFCLLSLVAPIRAEAASAEEESSVLQGNIKDVVLFVEFADEEGFFTEQKINDVIEKVFGREESDTPNPALSDVSLRNYFRAVSGDLLKISPYIYEQESEGEAVPLVVQAEKPRSYYELFSLENQQGYFESFFALDEQTPYCYLFDCGSSEKGEHTHAELSVALPVMCLHNY
ncbi:MAG: hypothetical protein IJF71_00365, partial [Clostridia bacterium]|nr:hypothetical protein [Clostridia bacterium]